MTRDEESILNDFLDDISCLNELYTNCRQLKLYADDGKRNR